MKLGEIKISKRETRKLRGEPITERKETDVLASQDAIRLPITRIRGPLRGSRRQESRVIDTEKTIVPDETALPIPAKGEGNEPPGSGPTEGAEFAEHDPFAKLRKELAYTLRFTNPQSQKLVALRLFIRREGLQNQLYKGDSSTVRHELGDISTNYGRLANEYPYLTEDVLDFFNSSTFINGYRQAVWEREDHQEGSYYTHDTFIAAARILLEDVEHIIHAKQEEGPSPQGGGQNSYDNAKTNLLYFVGGDWVPNHAEIETIKVRLAMAKAEEIEYQTRRKTGVRPKDRIILKTNTRRGQVRRKWEDVWLREGYGIYGKAARLMWTADDIFEGYLTAAKAILPATGNPRVDYAMWHQEATEAFAKDVNKLALTERIVRGTLKAYGHEFPK